MNAGAISGKRLNDGAWARSRARTGTKSRSQATDPSAGLRAGRSVRCTGSKAAGEGARPTRDEEIFAASTSKQRGELAEMMFMVKAAQKGFATAKPYGDSRRYDFVLDVGRRLWRVQVKSSSAKQYGSYMLNLQRNANGEVVPYDPAEIDFVVGYVMPCDAWFVIPVESIAGRATAKMCAKGNPRSGTMGKYWEAWGLMTMRWVDGG
jgi:PD-(D/E)XK nuclease superfamily protein